MDLLIFGLGLAGSVRLGTKQYAGFNIGSPKQLLEKLTLVLGEEPIDQKTQANRQLVAPHCGNTLARTR